MGALPSGHLCFVLLRALALCSTTAQPYWTCGSSDRDLSDLIRGAWLCRATREMEEELTLLALTFLQSRLGRGGPAEQHLSSLQELAAETGLLPARTDYAGESARCFGLPRLPARHSLRYSRACYRQPEGADAARLAACSCRSKSRVQRPRATAAVPKP